MTEFEKKIEFIRPAWNKRDPDPRKDKGIGCVMMRMALIGPKGAISWSIFTGWHLQKTWDEWEANGRHSKARDLAMGGGVTIHSPTQLYDWDDTPATCDLLPEGKCFGDTGFLAGETFFEVLVEKGEDAVWALMEEWYADHFEKQQVPS